MKINGHEMARLVVPERKGEIYIGLVLVNFLSRGAWVYCTSRMQHGCVTFGNEGRMMSTSIQGGSPLSRPYNGQSFILCVPRWALSDAGKKAAAKFEQEQQQ